jgi:aspartate aminotransferase
MIKIAGGVPIPVTARGGGFEPTVEEMAEAVGPYTKAVILNSPNNPSGIVYSDEFIAGVVELCEKRNLYLIMDDTYNRLIFDGRAPSNCYRFTQVRSLDSSKLVVINCVSKMYAMTGFRIGWAVGGKELIRAMTNIQSQETSGPAAPSQWAAVGALNGVQSSIESLRLTLENNRNVMMNRLAAFDGVEVVKPGGTFYCFPDFSAYERDSQKLSRLLLDKVRVVTVPGREFGMEGHLRLSFCGTVKDITEGIDRIKWVLHPGAPNELFLGDRKLVRDRR